MTHAYNEILLNKAADSLGRMLDFSVHSLHINADSMLNLFTASGTAALFERGDIKIVCGMSGIELAYEILERSGADYERTNPRHTSGLSPEYWYGYAIAMLQWDHCVSFDRLSTLLPSEELIKKYISIRDDALNNLPWNADNSSRQKSLSEAATRFIDSSCELYEKKACAYRQSFSSKDTRLKRMRIKSGLSQSELAKASGIPVRTIQQYEQRQKDINHARAEYLIMLSTALHCDPSVILEN